VGLAGSGPVYEGRFDLDFTEILRYTSLP
jgi:hypothetical protein